MAEKRKAKFREGDKVMICALQGKVHRVSDGQVMVRVIVDDFDGKRTCAYAVCYHDEIRPLTRRERQP
jgi:hypothetical protein